MLTDGRAMSASAMAALDMLARTALRLHSAWSSRRGRARKSMAATTAGSDAAVAAAAPPLSASASISAFSSYLFAIRR